MQIYRNQLGHADRAIARRWSVGAGGVYGSILLLMMLYVAFGLKPDAPLASNGAAVKLSIANEIPGPASMAERR